MANKHASEIDSTTLTQIFRQKTKSTAIGSWLILIYILTIGISILVLGSYQIQSRIRLVEINEHKISIWRLDEMSKYFEDARGRQESIDVEINRLQSISLETNYEIKILDLQYDKLFADFKNQLELTETTISERLPNHEFEHRLQEPTVNVRKIYNWFKEDISSLSLLENEQDQLNKLEIMVGSGAAVYAKIGGLKRNRLALIKKIETEQLKRQEIGAKVSNGIKGFDPAYKNFTVADATHLQNAVSEFSELKKLFLGSLYKLAIVPPELLVLFLVLAMGALGSTIFITQIFFNSDNKAFDVLFYLSRPFFGATIALSIFVLAKAGVLFLTDNPTGGARPSLSPFFISFIAIISGLMSEQAIITIRKAGERWFQNQQEGGDRWAVNVKTTITEKDKSAGDFASTVGISMETMNEWLNQKASVPFHMQQQIAAWLETKPQKLFTDLGPDDDVSKTKL